MVRCHLKYVCDCGGVITVAGMGGNSYIVHVNTYGGTKEFMLSYKRVENMIHHSLESGRRICKAEKHNRWFVQAIACLESGLMFIALFDVDVVVSPIGYRV